MYSNTDNAQSISGSEGLDVSMNSVQNEFIGSVRKMKAEQLQQAVQFFQEGNLIEAKTILEQLIVKFPEFSSAFNLRGLIAFREEQYDLALTSFEQAIQYQDDFAEAYLYRAYTLFKLDSASEELVQSLINALHFQPSLESHILDFLSEFSQSDGLYFKIIQVLYLKGQETKYRAAWELAMKACKEGDISRASVYYQELYQAQKYEEAGLIGVQLLKSQSKFGFSQSQDFKFDFNHAFYVMNMLNEAGLYDESKKLGIKIKEILKNYYSNCQDFIDPTLSSANPVSSPERTSTIYNEVFERCFEYFQGSRLSGDILEFGTYKGYTARIIATKMNEHDFSSHLYLFDSFVGFPEIDSVVDQKSYEVEVHKVWQKGSLVLNSNIEKLIERAISKIIHPEYLTVSKGFFEQTLEPLIPKIKKPALIHMDCDLYASAKYVLEMLIEHDLFQDGAVILFDDFNCNKANPNMGERKALQEVLDSQERFSCSLFFTYGWNGQAFFIHDSEVKL